MAFGTGVSAFAEDGFISLAPIEEPEEENFEEIEYIEEETELLNAYAENSLEEIIRPQIEAYVKSIDIADADGRAKDAVAKHGISGKGKKLSVKEGHVLTATIYNSNMMKDMLIDGCASAIKSMNELDINVLPYIHGCANWRDSSSNYFLHVMASETNNYKYRDWTLVKKDFFEKNTYDNSLVWIAGSTNVDISIEKIKAGETELTYKITCTVSDRFDFDTNAGLGSVLGALFFKEYDWEAKVSFNIKVPYSCSHSMGNFHLFYDTENHMLITDSSNGYTENISVPYEYVKSSGEVFYYFKLDKTIRLYHNKPWVVEFTAKNPGNFMLAPLEKESILYDSLFNYNRSLFAIRKYEREELTKEQQIEFGTKQTTRYYVHHYGVRIGKIYSSSKEKMYRYTLENVIYSDGSNMLYLTVYNIDDDKMMLEYEPMDNYYYTDEYGERLALKSENNSYVNGKDSEPQSCFSTKTTTPTCTEKGTATHTCTLCGYSYTEEIAAKDHSLGEWSVYAEPTVGKAGEERRSCANCDYYESKEIAAYRYGDVNCDGKVNTVDANYVRRYSAGLLTLDERQMLAADVDGNGAINVLDSAIIRRYVVKHITSLPHKETA
ncbi:MAG: dockerin type I repeat-containing protein [Oscillospiraceae bacterium]|nr:dockerin type I repeat-containing protein [Oscillospiraceae bacterium]